MARSRRLTNPLALAVLALLFERPMHPYEMASTLRLRNKEDSIKLNYGALYTVVAQLQGKGLILARGTARAGKYPERTVYELTPAGRDEMRDWLRELLSTPVKEFTRFEAGLSLMPVLPPDEVAGLLRARAERLGDEIARLRTDLAVAEQHGVEALFLVEVDYRLTLREAERAWVSDLAERVTDEGWSGVGAWRAFQAERTSPPGATTVHAAADAAGGHDTNTDADAEEPGSPARPTRSRHLTR